MAERAPWTGELIGKMHVQCVTQDDLAKELDVSKAYISMLLNGRKASKHAEQKLNDAFRAIIERREHERA